MKRYTVWILLFGFIAHSFAQSDPVLLRIDDDMITRSEFELALHKHYKTVLNDKKQIKEYLNHFINDRLKIAESKRQKLYEHPTVKEKLAQSNGLMNSAASTNIYKAWVNKENENDEVERWEIMQIFKRIPQNSSNKEEKESIRFMQSLYAKLKDDPRADFTSYVEQYSDDRRTRQVGLFQMTPEFEDKIRSMNKGDLSGPFITPQGIHIIKVIDKKQNPPYDMLKKAAKKNHLMNDMQSIQRLKDEYNYTPNENGIHQLLSTGSTNKRLFTLNGNGYSGEDFCLFAEGNPKGIRQQLNDYIVKSLCDYDRLTHKYPENFTKDRLSEEDILLKEIHLCEVTNKARNDRAGLVAYFSVHKKQYRWPKPRFQGLVLHVQNKKVLSAAKKLVKGKPLEQWQDLINQVFNVETLAQVKIQQGIFAEGDNEFVDKLAFKKGDPAPMPNYPYTALIGKKIKGPDHYEQILERVISDYEEFLERRWISALHKAYQVEINEEVLKTVNNH